MLNLLKLVTQILILISIPTLCLALADLLAPINTPFEQIEEELQLSNDNRPINEISATENRYPTILDGEMTTDDITLYLMNILGISPILMIEEEGESWAYLADKQLDNCATENLASRFIELLEGFRMQLIGDVSINHALKVNYSNEYNPSNFLGQGYDYVYTQGFLTIPGMERMVYMVKSEFYFDSNLYSQEKAEEILFHLWMLKLDSSSHKFLTNCDVRTNIFYSPKDVIAFTANHYKILNYFSYTISVIVENEPPTEPRSSVLRHQVETQIANALRELF